MYNSGCLGCRQMCCVHWWKHRWLPTKCPNKIWTLSLERIHNRLQPKAFIKHTWFKIAWTTSIACIHLGCSIYIQAIQAGDCCQWIKAKVKSNRKRLTSQVTKQSITELTEACLVTHGTCSIWSCISWFLFWYLPITRQLKLSIVFCTVYCWQETPRSSRAKLYGATGWHSSGQLYRLHVY